MEGVRRDESEASMGLKAKNGRPGEPDRASQKDFQPHAGGAKRKGKKGGRP